MMYDIQQDVLKALEEDIGSGDVTAQLLPPEQQAMAMIVSREPMLVCGQAWVNAVFSSVDPSVSLDWQVQEGAYLETGTTLCLLQGAARSILTAERTALNFLQTLSATATTTYRYVQRLKTMKTRLLDTRKTLPGLRHAQKYAVTCGGGVNHRMGLYDAYLIKENHIRACGSITAAIALARQQKPGWTVEVEVESLVELREALQAKPDRIMLDNFDLMMIREAVRIRGVCDCELEVSGGIHLDNIAQIAAEGVDFISVGDLTKSLRAIDLSLLFQDLS